MSATHRYEVAALRDLEELRSSAHPIGLIGVEQHFGANGAGRELAAGVLLELRQVHAGVAVHAVAGIDSQALPPAAQVAEGAVVDGPPLLVVPQPADAAVVPAQPRLASLALRCILIGVRNSQAMCGIHMLENAELGERVNCFQWEENFAVRINV